MKFGKIELESPYLWLKGKGFKPLAQEMNIKHCGRSLLVNRALSDFGIEDSFDRAAKRFKEHYNFEIGPSAVDRATKESANLAGDYIEKKLSGQKERGYAAEPVAAMLVEMDGCAIRTAEFVKDENANETTPAYGNPKKRKIVNWRDVRLGFAKPLEADKKTFVVGMDSYPVVAGRLRDAAVMRGMDSSTKIIGVADGGNGLKEDLQRQFPGMRFILDKSHLKDHLYDTAEELWEYRRRRGPDG